MRDTASREAHLPPSLIAAVLVLSALPFALQGLGLALPSGQSFVARITLHVFMEWSAVCLSLATACLAFLYYRLRPEVLVLTIGLAAFLSGLWDALHALESAGLLPASVDNEVATPVTWTASRTFRAAAVTAGAIWIWLDRAPPSRAMAGVGVAAATFAAAWLHVSLGGELAAPIRPSRFVARPWDVPALVLFVVSAILLWRTELRQEGRLLGRVLLLGAVPEVVSQLEMVFFSRALYDPAFVFAHFSKLVACATPSAGILIELTRGFRREVQGRDRMEELVSELEATTEALRVKETHLEQLTHGIREVFWISEPDGSKMYYVSPLYEEVFGQPVETLYADPAAFLKTVVPEDRPMMADLSKRRIDEEFEVDYRIERPGGDIRWLRTRGFPLRDDNGRVYRLSGVTEDVTEHKVAEETIRVSEARMRALFSALPDLLLRANRKGLVLDFHGRLDREATDVLGSHLGEVLPAPPERVSRVLEATFESSGVHVLDYRAVANGQTGEFEARFVRSAVDEVLVLVRDLTEQKTLEREILEVSQREQDRIGSDLHDGIAQSLTGIALLSEVLVRELQSGDRPEAKQAGQIARLVEQTLVRTRTLARGLAPVELDEGGFLAALEEMASGVEALYPVRCLCRCDEAAVVKDHEKAIQLYRIAQEAVTNAVKHANASSIEISLLRRNGRYVMSIRDDGIGVDESRLARSARGDGAGMGLHIMRYRARIIDANIELRPNGKQGTVVTCQWAAAD